MYLSFANVVIVFLQTLLLDMERKLLAIATVESFATEESSATDEVMIIQTQ